MAKITVDGQLLDVPDGQNLLEALLALGMDLPYFCWHPKMGSVGACRQCAVVQYANEEDQRGRIVMSCMTPVAEGTIFSLAGEKASGFRESVVENLMLNHPHDCPVCEEGGECHLQDMTVMTGHRDRNYRYLKTTFTNQYLGPFIGHEMNRCITCYRCVRYYQDYAGGHDLAAFASRDRVFFGRSEDGVLENEFAGNLVEVCPTGVFTDKTLSAHYTRKWDLESAPAICVGCSLGCNVTASERYGELRRIHNRYHGDLNGYFLCDRGRFGWQYVNDDKRLTHCGVRTSTGLYQASQPKTVLSGLKESLGAATSVAGIGSPRASLEANYLLRLLVGPDNFYSGESEANAEINRCALQALRSSIRTPSLTEVEAADVVLILGEDTTDHAPRLALSIRQAAGNAGREMALRAGIPHWQDAAVRKLAQNVHSPVFVLTTYADRLDDIGIPTRLHPDAIAEAGFAIAHTLNDEFPNPTNIPGEIDIGAIAAALSSAKNPLVVTGSSPGSPNIVRAAMNVAAALQRQNPAAGLIICPTGPNSLGTSLLTDRTFPNTTGGVAIVVENDLFENFPGESLQQWQSELDQLITLDSLDNGTCSMAHVVMPATTFADGTGTYVNYEGRAQRSFGAFKPGEDTAPSWQWLLQLCHDQGKALEIKHLDDVLTALANEFPELRGVIDAAPGAGFRDHGQKVSRMTHRASGRTAMLADLSVHEPMQPADTETSLTYSMEGTNASAPAALKSYTWAPGWNSNQSINKFQDEIAGHLRGGDPGILLFGDDQVFAVQTPAEGSPTDSPTIIPRWHIFGSEALTGQGEAIVARSPRPYIQMNSHTAGLLNVAAGQALHSENLADVPSLPVIIDEGTPDNCLVCPVLPGTYSYFHNPGNLKPDASWQPAEPPDLITTDRST